MIAGELLPQAYEDITGKSATNYTSSKPDKANAVSFISSMTELLGPGYALTYDAVRKAMTAMDWVAIRRSRKQRKRGQ